MKYIDVYTYIKPNANLMGKLMDMQYRYTSSTASSASDNNNNHHHHHHYD